MKNIYRVDRNDELRVPCGMMSILFMGNSLQAARNSFARHAPGFDFWGKPNAAYGVILSRWNESARDYVVIESKGVTKCGQ